MFYFTCDRSFIGPRKTHRSGYSGDDEILMSEMHADLLAATVQLIITCVRLLSYGCSAWRARCHAVTGISTRVRLFMSPQATYIRLLHGKMGFFGGFFGPSSVHRGRTQIVFG